MINWSIAEDIQGFRTRRSVFAQIANMLTVDSYFRIYISKFTYPFSIDRPMATAIYVTLWIIAYAAVPSAIMPRQSNRNVNHFILSVPKRRSSLPCTVESDKLCVIERVICFMNLETLLVSVSFCFFPIEFLLMRGFWPSEGILVYAVPSMRERFVRLGVLVCRVALLSFSV